MFENITFANPKLLWGLLIIPAAIVWYVLRHKKQEASVRYSDTTGFDNLPKSWKVYARHILFALKMAALGLLIVAVARPQSSSSSQTSNIEGIDIILAQDISGSMLARDLKPDRLEASKKVAADFIEGRKNDRMALVVFAGEAFTQVPLTIDHHVLLKQLGDLKSGIIRDGTALGDGLATAINRIKDSDGDRKATLVYDPFAFLHTRKWQLVTGGIALGILLLGLLLGLLIGGGKGGEKKVRAPKEEKVVTEQPAPAETKTAPAGLKAYLDTVKVLDRRMLDKYGQAALYDALNTYDGAKADSIAKSLEAKGLILELVDNMRYYTGLLQQSGKAKPSQWGEDQTINLERFNNSISNKISELSK